MPLLVAPVDSAMADGGSGRSASPADTLCATSARHSARPERTSARHEPTNCVGCHLCKSSEKPLPHCVAGIRMCNQCNAGVRSKHRALRKENGADALREDRQLMISDPAAWRKETIEFSDRSTRVSARILVKKRVVKTKQNRRGRRHERRRPKLTMTKTRYKNYVCFWDNVDSAEASSDYERLLVEQGRRDNVQVEGNEQDDSVSFSEHASCTDEEEVHEEDTPQAQRQERSSRGAIESRPASGRRTERRSSRSRDRRRPAAQHGGDRRGGHRAEGAPASSAGADGQSARPQKKPKSAGASRMEVAKEIAADNENVGFLVRRDELKSKVKASMSVAAALVLKLTGVTSAFTKKHGEPNHSDLPHPTDELLTQATQAEVRFGKFASRIQDVKEAELPAISAEAMQADKELEIMQGKVKKQLETLQYLRANKGSEHRSCYQAKRWRLTRLQGQLCNGSFEPGLASLLAKAVNRIYDKADKPPLPQVDPEGKCQIFLNKPWSECSKMQPAVWTTEHLPYPKEFFEQHSANIMAKAEELVESVKENVKWRGAMGEIENVNLDMNFGDFGAVEALASPGGKPWMLAVRMTSKRCSPRNFPMPGLPTVVRSLDEHCVVAAAPVEGALAKGITIENMEQCWATAEGEKHWAEHGFITRLKVGEVCYLPPTWWPVVTACPLELIAGKQTKATLEHIATCMCVTLFSKEFMADTKEDSLKAIKHANSQVLDSKAAAAGAMDMWKHRKATFDGLSL